MKRILVATGGTGGHIFPAIAVIEEVKEIFPKAEVLFVGGYFGPEEQIVREAGIPFKGLPARGVLGRGFKSLSSIFWMIKSGFLSRKIIKEFNPDVVLGLGGYAGFVPVLIAHWMRIPTAIHEQNSIPGITNRVLGRRVKKIFLSFPDEHHFFQEKKVLITGNPVRKEIISRALENSKEQRKNSRNVLVFGGSQGAKAINEAVTAALATFKSQDIALWHQTGNTDYERVVEEYQLHGVDHSRVQPFIKDMAEAYSWADLVVGRAGASTVAELTAAGKPSILIPFPYATHDHQLINAKFLEAKGSAMVVVQSYLEEVNLARIVDDLLAMPKKLQDMAAATRKMGHPEAAKNIVMELEKLIQQKNNKKKK